MTNNYDIDDDRRKAFARFTKLGLLRIRPGIVFKATGLNSMTKMSQGDYVDLFAYLDLIDKEEDQKQNFCAGSQEGKFCNPVKFSEEFVNCSEAGNCKKIYFEGGVSCY